MGVGVTGVAEVRAVGIAVSATVSGSLGISVAKEIIAQNNQESYQKVAKKKKKRSNKGKRHIPIASASRLPPSSLSESKTLFFATSSSLESSRTSSYPSSENKFASDPQVAKLGMDKGLTTNEEPSFTA